MLVWRIGTDTPEYTAEDPSGRGAESTGGRWNRKGTPMLYASSSRALACLETLVHFSTEPQLPLNRFLIQFEIPDEAWEDREEYPVDGDVGWMAQPPGRVSLDWGTNWAEEQRSVVAEVPSVIVPEEENVLVNPQHPGFGGLRITKIRQWVYDFRLKPHL